MLKTNTMSSQKSIGNIYFVCPDKNRPLGGVKVIYRHVDILNENGFRAYVLHKTEGFKCTWFTNETATTYYSQLNIQNNDILVIPEFYSEALVAPTTVLFIQQLLNKFKKTRVQDLLRNIVKQVDRVVIFNQNPYYTFNNSFTDSNTKINPYSHPKVIATLVVSEDSLKYLKFVFPELWVERVYNGIGIQFALKGLDHKKKQICYMPRKRVNDVKQIIKILEIRGHLNQYEFISIDRKSTSEVADIMRSSMIFLSFNSCEGLGLPPLEAMKCGCIVIGYHGQGGMEYLKPEFSYPVSDGNIIQYVKIVESVVQELEKDPLMMQEKTIRAEHFIENHYSTEIETNSIISFWQKVQDFNKNYLI